MEIFDLTQPLLQGFPAYPGDPAPTFNKDASLTRDGYRQQTIRIVSHSGTHIDAPGHMMSRGYFLDDMPASHFVGRALLLSITEPGPIEPQTLIKQVGDLVYEAGFLLFHTGWGKLWGKKAYYRNYPFLSPECSRWLAQLADPSLPKIQRGMMEPKKPQRYGKLRGIGVDSPSPDPFSSTAYPAHMVLMEAGLLIMENIVIPDALIGETQVSLKKLNEESKVTLCALPLPLQNADGAPARIVAMKE